MKLSLLVPCYNAEKFIDKFITNISNLSRPFDEVLFYDDASTDNTVQILRSKGYKVIKGEVNRGPGHARNQLVNASTGDYFHFHDIDDLLSPDYLVKVSDIAKNKEFDVILCNVDWYDTEQKNIILSWNYSNKEINENPAAYTIAHPIGGINGLYKREKFIETGGFSTQIRIWEDADLHVRLAAKNAVFYVVEETLSFSIRYPASASADQASGWLIRLELLNQYYDIFKDKAIRTEIGKQAQLAASRLIMYRKNAAAKQALQLSEKCNLKVPDNNNYLWHLLKIFTPALFRISLRMMQLKIAFQKTT